MTINTFIDTTFELNKSNHDGLKTTINNNMFRGNKDATLNKISDLTPYLDSNFINDNEFYKAINVPYSNLRGQYILNLPNINNETIITKTYSPSKLLILLDNKTIDSVFSFKLSNNNKLLTIKAKNVLCINNLKEFYNNVKNKASFVSKKNGFNWLLSDNQYDKKLTFIVLYKCINDVIINAVNNDTITFVINLDKDVERMNNIKKKYNYLKPVRIPAIHNDKGFIGLLKTNHHILSSCLKANILSKCPIIMEDDCLLLDEKDVFLKRWGKYKKYLIEHWGEWNYFSGGSIYLKPIKIINKEPCIVECSYGLCTQFIVHSPCSSKKVIDYVDKKNMRVGIDRLLCKDKDTFWVPYPFLCIQKSKETNISRRLDTRSYLNIIQTEFVKSRKVLEIFVNRHITN